MVFKRQGRRKFEWQLSLLAHYAALSHLNMQNNICLLALEAPREARSRGLNTGGREQQISRTAERDLKALGC